MIPEAVRRGPPSRVGDEDRAVMCAFADMLEPAERDLLLAIYRDRSSIAAYADRLGMARRTIYARHARLLERLQRPEAELSVLYQRYLPASLREAAELVWVAGVPATVAGPRLGLGTAASRHMADKLATIARFWANIREDLSA